MRILEAERQRERGSARPRLKEGEGERWRESRVGKYSQYTRDLPKDNWLLHNVFVGHGRDRTGGWVPLQILCLCRTFTIHVAFLVCFLL